MKFVVACDAFDNSLTTFEAGEAAKEGILKAKPDATVKMYGMATGGRGMYEVLVRTLNGQTVCTKAHNAVGKSIDVEYTIATYHGEKAAIINAASVIGIAQIKKRDLDPYAASSFGLGEVIKDGLKNQCKVFIIALGGSATNDCGLGMLKELGFSFTNSRGNEVGEGCEALCDVYKISSGRVIDGLTQCKFIVSYDIDNPLCGENGATITFAYDKGAADEMLADMDQYMGHFARMTKNLYPLADKNQKGAGASGGLGYAFATYLGAKLGTGHEIISELSDLEEEIKDADYVITGEGKAHIEAMNKNQCIPVMISTLAHKYDKKVISFVDGQASENRKMIEGIDACYGIADSGKCLGQFDTKNEQLQALSKIVESVVKTL